jgi:SOS response regulatory protein OraA/RecX
MTQQALQDLPESAYDEQLIAMARRKWEALKNDPQAFAKTCRYLQQKGYEAERFLPLVREWQSHQG